MKNIKRNKVMFNISNELEKIKNILQHQNVLSFDEISKKNNWSPKFKKENRELLDIWIENGEIIKNKKNKYALPETFGFIKGTFSNINGKFGFVDTDNDSFFISKNNFSGALNGDIVFVKNLNVKSGEKKEGEVVKIIKREQNKIVGVFEKKENFGFVTATETFGKDVYIPRKFFNNAQNGELVFVEITFFGDENKKPEGKIIENLGVPTDTNNMIKALLMRENLSEEFPEEVKKEIKDIDVNISSDEIKRRVDLRHLQIITIDGDDAKDLDDAVYVKKLENNFYKLIVSIADVSHYIKENSKLDKEAEQRGNSVYLVDRVLPMFPKEISNGFCSLNPNEDKLTFTVELLIDNKGRILDIETYKGIINTSYRMTYNNVNKILDGDEELTNKYLDIKDMLFEMLELSKIIRTIKYNRGYINFDIPETKVILDENKKVKYLKTIVRGEAEKIIEDFMIVTNEAIAEKLFWLEIPSIYRVHEIPDSEKIAKLNETLMRFGYNLQNNEDLHPKKIQKILEESEANGINMIIHKMILRSLKQARYSHENVGHFGLSSNYYTHFTSPIRRYSDLLVHRILNIAIQGYPTKKQYSNLIKYLPEVTEHISKTERKAMSVENESIKIKVTEYMLDKVGEEFKAIVTGFSNKKVFFETEEHVECFWDVTTAKNFYEFDETLYKMKDTNSNMVFNLGDKLNILIARVDLNALTIEVIPTELY